MTNWSQIFKKKKLDGDSFDHARVTTGLSLQKDLIQANAVADSTVAETVDEVATEVVVAATEVAVAETVDEAAATEVVAVADSVSDVKAAAVAVLADTEDFLE